MVIKPDYLMSSPAKRAITTAIFFSEAFEIDPNTITRDPTLYEALPQDIHRVISRLPETAKTVFIFGHNPTFTDIANHFTEDFIDNLPTCGVVKITSSAASWDTFYEGNSKVIACYFPKEVL
jgi:phosphohistidine phosphatase